MSQVGSIVFGPNSVGPHSAAGYSLQGMSINSSHARACNCMGPQPGETKCPCMLSGEAEKGRRMVQDGVTINGKRYKLVEAS